MKMIAPNTDAVSPYASFTRASVATYVNPEGILKTAAVDVPRYESGVLLYEASATNYLVYSGDLSNAAWQKTNCTVAAGGSPPDGSGAATAMTRTATGDHYLFGKNDTLAPLSGKTFTFSVWLKAGTLTGNVLLRLQDENGNVAGSNTVTPTASWTRYSVSGTFSGGGLGTSTRCVVNPTDDAGSAGQTLYVWGAQLESGTAATSYIATTSAVASRSADSWGVGYIHSSDPTGSAPYVVSDAQNYPYTTTEWNPATSYSLNQLAWRATTHRIYKRLVAGTTATAPESDATNWLDIMPTKKWSPFDGSVNTGYISSELGRVHWTFPANAATGIALFGIRATKCLVTVKSAVNGSVLYSAQRTFSATPEPYYGATYLRDSWFLSGLPGGSFNVITVTAESNDYLGAGISEIVTGFVYDLGDTQYGARVGITDYSRKSVDEFGVATIVQRTYAKRMEAEVLVDKAALTTVMHVLSDMRATPCAFVASELSEYDSTVVYGWCRRFDLAISYPTKALLAIDVEGLT